MGLVFKNLKTDEKHVIVVGSISAEFSTPDGKPVRGAQYVMALSDGTQRKGTLTPDGKLTETNIKPGVKASLSLVGNPLLALAE